MTIKDRILTFIKDNGISREDFYRETGLSASNFKGAALKSELGGDKIVKILTTYKNLSSEWLLTGEGSMTKMKVYNNPEEHLSCVSEPNLSYNNSENSLYYKMYKEEKEENKELLKQIGRLEEKLKSYEEKLKSINI